MGEGIKPSFSMLTSSNGNIFRVTGHLCGEFTGPQMNHKGKWRGVLMFSVICVWINSWENNREAGDLICYRAHYDVNVMLGDEISHPTQNRWSNSWSSVISLMNYVAKWACPDHRSVHVYIERGRARDQRWTSYLKTIPGMCCQLKHFPGKNHLWLNVWRQCNWFCLL